MRLETLPARMLIIGGGFVAAEFAHVFGSFGTRVTIVNRSAALLRAEDDDISAAFTEVARSRWDVRLETHVTKVEAYDGGVRAQLSDGSTVEVDTVLVAAGREPNSDGLDLDRTGVEVDEDGVVVVDRHQRTGVEGIWALGDIANHFQLKHVSNLEARVVQHNLLHPDDLWSPGTTWCRARCSPTRRSPASGSPSGRPSSGACGTSWPGSATATRPTAGRWRTPPGSPSWSPTRTPG